MTDAQVEPLSPYALSILGAVVSWPVRIDKLVPSLARLFLQRGLITETVLGKDDVYAATDAGFAAVGKVRDANGQVRNA